MLLVLPNVEAMESESSLASGILLRILPAKGCFDRETYHWPPPNDSERKEHASALVR